MEKYASINKKMLMKCLLVKQKKEILAQQSHWDWQKEKCLQEYL
jgi:hypothetical protein